VSQCSRTISRSVQSCRGRWPASGRWLRSRLIHIRRAYAADAEADQLDEAGDAAAANAKRQEAFELAPEIVELRFWAGVALTTSGDLDGGSALIAEAVKDDARWLETLRRLVIVDRLSGEMAAAIEARVSK
jgi:hypothetical protein